MKCRVCDKVRHSAYYYANREKISKSMKYINMFSRYGLTKNVYDALLSSQNNRCAICKEVPKKCLMVDHCHKTMQVRGLLCRHCNTLLGMAKDNKSTLENAINYLK